MTTQPIHKCRAQVYERIGRDMSNVVMAFVDDDWTTMVGNKLDLMIPWSVLSESLGRGVSSLSNALYVYQHSVIVESDCDEKRKSSARVDLETGVVSRWEHGIPVGSYGYLVRRRRGILIVDGDLKTVLSTDPQCVFYVQDRTIWLNQHPGYARVHELAEGQAIHKYQRIDLDSMTISGGFQLPIDSYWWPYPNLGFVVYHNTVFQTVLHQASFTSAVAQICHRVGYIPTLLWTIFDHPDAKNMNLVSAPDHQVPGVRCLAVDECSRQIMIGYRYFVADKPYWGVVAADCDQTFIVLLHRIEGSIQAIAIVDRAVFFSAERVMIVYQERYCSRMNAIESTIILGSCSKRTRNMALQLTCAHEFRRSFIVTHQPEFWTRYRHCDFIHPDDDTALEAIRVMQDALHDEEVDRANQMEHQQLELFQRNHDHRWNRVMADVELLPTKDDIQAITLEYRRQEEAAILWKEKHEYRQQVLRRGGICMILDRVFKPSTLLRKLSQNARYHRICFIHIRYDPKSIHPEFRDCGVIIVDCENFSSKARKDLQYVYLRQPAFFGRKDFIIIRLDESVASSSISLDKYWSSRCSKRSDSAIASFPTDIQTIIFSFMRVDDLSQFSRL